MNAKRIFRTPIFWLFIAIAIAFAMFNMDSSGGYARIDTNQAEQLISDGHVEKAKLTSENVLDLDLKEGQTYTSPDESVRDATQVRTEFVDARAEEIVALVGEHVGEGGYNDTIERSSAFWSFFMAFAPIILLVGLFWFLMSQAQGGGGRVMQFGKSKAKLATKDMPKVTFADVAGADEAVEELQEIKEFLRERSQVPRRRRQDPQGCAPLRPTGHRQTRPRGRR